MEFKNFSKEIPSHNITDMNIHNIPIPIFTSMVPPRVFITSIITTTITTTIITTTITPRESKILINNDIKKGI
ncbi:hypothetical protein [Paenibacillus agri]|uniref:Uncharacterized protein n=1 Tax=Paenibacillus agri TaxID=2744309 RepID=A0A850ENW5_9BACL|nr:hypothetical protein [Paenibacillus agri]NUU60302.1 hypothetical protein [Paenibacillus agri]